MQYIFLWCSYVCHGPLASISVSFPLVCVLHNEFAFFVHSLFLIPYYIRELLSIFNEQVRHFVIYSSVHAFSMCLFPSLNDAYEKYQKHCRDAVQEKEKRKDRIFLFHGWCVILDFFRLIFSVFVFHISIYE